MLGWRACLAAAPPRPLAGTLRRLVESQEQVATSQLVASLDRQAVLEDLLEQTKPPLRPGAETLHYLLSTPFRYPPLRWGSRFGARSEPSLFYGSLETVTVLWEAAYYRAGIEVFEYVSARDPDAGINVGLFTPLVFARPAPVFQEAWLAEVDGERARFRAVHGKEVHDFPVGCFLVDSRLPQAA